MSLTAFLVLCAAMYLLVSAVAAAAAYSQGKDNGYYQARQEWIDWDHAEALAAEPARAVPDLGAEQLVADSRDAMTGDMTDVSTWVDDQFEVIRRDLWHGTRPPAPSIAAGDHPIMVAGPRARYRHRRP